MKSSLIISDLSYLQPINEHSVVVGSGKVYANTDTLADTSYEYALGGAGAVAIGDSTYTNTKTKAQVKKVGYLSSSTADATAKAYASSDYQTASSFSNDSSISLFISND
ncbi:TonB-dependent receptor [Aerosakkonemataceae cyanobacterium BLCC-F154]|uniref:TonB-dependent receptor n=1 Tax=Floridaenema fluviatile BLCC-F154 TaxID=3153640 RepID=A0ABV4Y560_9CYAN